jgi:hypothetical protein
VIMFFKHRILYAKAVIKQTAYLLLYSILYVCTKCKSRKGTKRHQIVDKTLHQTNVWGKRTTLNKQGASEGQEVPASVGRVVGMILWSFYYCSTTIMSLKFSPIWSVYTPHIIHMKFLFHIINLRCFPIYASKEKNCIAVSPGDIKQ